MFSCLFLLNYLLIVYVQQDVLCSVLSQLPMEEAVKTSILSCQWKYIWCHQTSLNFNCKTIMPRVAWSTREAVRQEFIKRVNAVLRQRNGAGVEKMNIRFDLDDRHAADVDRWVNLAIASKTKVLTLELWLDSPAIVYRLRVSDPERMEPYNFPFQLFDECNGSHLRSLHLSTVSLKLPTNFKGFLNLKKLYLSGVSITDEDLGHFVSKCSVLEFLGVLFCTMLETLTIPHSANQLKHLQIRCCPLLHKVRLNYSLKMLVYKGPVTYFVSDRTSSLTDACINLLDVRTSLKHLFAELSGSTSCPKSVATKCRDLERSIPPRSSTCFLGLRHVKLEVTILVSSESGTDVLDLGHLLKAAPSMEKLELHMWMRRKHKPYCRDDGDLRILPAHPHSHLKLVHITGFYGHKDQLELADHILRNCVVLEEMKVDPRVAIEKLSTSEDEYEESRNLDGLRVASEFLHDADRHGALTVSLSLPRPKVTMIWI